MYLHICPLLPTQMSLLKSLYLSLYSYSYVYTHTVTQRTELCIRAQRMCGWKLRVGVESVRRPCDQIAPLPVWSAPRELSECVAMVAGFLGLSYFNIFFKAVVTFQKGAKS